MRIANVIEKLTKAIAEVQPPVALRYLEGEGFAESYAQTALIHFTHTATNYEYEWRFDVRLNATAEGDSRLLRLKLTVPGRYLINPIALEVLVKRVTEEVEHALTAVLFAEGSNPGLPPLIEVSDDLEQQIIRAVANSNPVPRVRLPT